MAACYQQDLLTEVRSIPGVHKKRAETRLFSRISIAFVVQPIDLPLCEKHCTTHCHCLTHSHVILCSW